ncbi:VOC family protein [Cypionkella sp.]|jgi:PhnB protein|uniref:VOC family protein n=1 Tax=Cypionkella sp. TaxID=2811411 RepID=UPI0037500A02
MPTMPYIHFQGQCAEALEFYKTVFNGSNLQIMRYGDGPDVPAAWRDSARVMHGQVSLFDGTLMASDYPPGDEGHAQAGVSVMQSVPDLVQAEQVFNDLLEQGALIHAFGPTFFSPGFGMVKDKFGTHWIISAMPAAV